MLVIESVKQELGCHTSDVHLTPDQNIHLAQSDNTPKLLPFLGSRIPAHQTLVDEHIPVAFSIPNHLSGPISQPQQLIDVRLRVRHEGRLTSTLPP